MNKIFLIAIIFCSNVAIFSAPRWIALAPEAVNYDSTKLAILGDLLSQELNVQDNITVQNISGEQFNRTNLATPDSLKPLMSQHQAQFGYCGKISRIDKTIFIFLEKWNADGTIVFRQRVSVQEGEDLDALIKRLATCLIKEEEFAKTATTTTIVEKEGIASKRKGSKMLLVGRAGFLYPIGEKSFRTQTRYYSGYYNYSDTTSSIEYDEGTAFFMEAGFAFDVNVAIMEATIGFDQTRDVSFSIAGEYPLFKGDISPYIGAEIGATIVNKASSDFDNEAELEKNSDGMSLGLRVGAFFFRNHVFKLMPEIRIVTVLNKDHDTGIRFTVGAMLF